MKFLDFFYLVISSTFLLTLNLRIGYAVPPEYCLHQLNTSDCRAKPSPVFFYYKPGSRCELDTWRGCPTYNKFDNQYQCISTCIYKYRDSSENKIYKYITPDENLFVEDNYEMNFEDEIDTLPAKEKLILQNILDDIKKLINTTTPQTTATNTTDYQELTNLSTNESVTFKTTTVGVESTPKKVPTTNQKTAQKVKQTTNHITTQEPTTHEEPTTTQPLTVNTQAEPTTTFVTTTSTEPTTETKTTEITTPIVTSSKTTTINDEDIPRPSTKPTTTATTPAATTTEPPVVTEKITTTVVSTTNKNLSSGEADEVIIMRNKNQ